MSQRILLAGLLLCVSSASAFAGCKLPTFEFFPERNDHVVVTGVVAKGTTCVHKLGEGPGYHFTSVESARDPEHGALSVVPGATITYKPKARFGGKDFYGIRACATKEGGAKGCSTIYYVLSMQ
jgi:hypothetical protein